MSSSAAVPGVCLFTSADALHVRGGNRIPTIMAGAWPFSHIERLLVRVLESNETTWRTFDSFTDAITDGTQQTVAKIAVAVVMLVYGLTTHVTVAGLAFVNKAVLDAYTGVVFVSNHEQRSHQVRSHEKQV